MSDIKYVSNGGDVELLLSAAADVMALARDTVLINRSFFARATGNLELKALALGETSSLMSDCGCIYYEPLYVVKTYSAPDGNEVTVRNYFHMLLHSICQHMYVGAVDTELWDLATDIAVESIINEMELDCVKTQKSMYQKAIEDAIKNIIPALTAERIYNLLRSGKIKEEYIEQWKLFFSADRHDLWYMSAEDKMSAFGIKSPGGEGNGDGYGTGGDSESGAVGKIFAMGYSALWKEIAAQLRVDLESFNSSVFGNTAGALVQNIKELERDRYDYSSFLRKFAVLGEEMKLNQDEFDYIFYTYGLNMYGNMPLIEPLEYKDVKRIKDFVIAIDTSGSVMGDMVQAFIKKTYNILQEEESFSTKINLHIVQCDTEIQSSVKITSKEEFDEYIKNATLKGFGGTDFRPVFAYVDKMIEKGEFKNLKGIIYFTDGYGTFPKKAPTYETAFVFVDLGQGKEYLNPNVPPWAIKLVLEEKDIK